MRRPTPPLPRRFSHERWLVSYADFVTLLFAFFTMMYAVSTIDAKKLDAMVTGFQDALHVNGPTPVAALPLNLGASPPDASLGFVHAQLARHLSVDIALRRVVLERDPRGLVISLREAGTFAVGSADLSDAAMAALDTISEALRDVDNVIRVEGHTDDVPIHTARYASNWELSTTRATQVVAYFVQRFKVAPERLSAAGYAEFRPRYPNDSIDNRARNRRVDIVVLSRSTSDAEEPTGPVDD